MAKAKKTPNGKKDFNVSLELGKMVSKRVKTIVTQVFPNEGSSINKIIEPAVQEFVAVIYEIADSTVDKLAKDLIPLVIEQVSDQIVRNLVNQITDTVIDQLADQISEKVLIKFGAVATISGEHIGKNLKKEKTKK